MGFPKPDVNDLLGINLPTLDLAILVASLAHAGQRDKQDAPYILHPMEVMLKVPSEVTKIVAVLHDVAEDTEYDLEYLSSIFDEEIVTAVAAMTRVSGQSYAAYIEQVLQNKLATEVKLADATHNLERLNGLPPSLQDSLRKRYTMVIDRCQQRIASW